MDNIVSANTRTKKNLTNVERHAAYEALLQQRICGKLKKEAISNVATLFGTSKRIISRIWLQAKRQFIEGPIVDMSSRRAMKVGRKRVQIDPGQISKILLAHRTNIRSITTQVSIPKSTVHKRIKEGALWPHTNAIKPYLTDENKKARLEFCLSMVAPSNSIADLMFHDMFNAIHIDEKWFYMSRPVERYYLLPNEAEPTRACKSKKFITKVKFLVVVARPRFDSSGNETFSKKIGVFPFISIELAKHSSKNRSAGTLETKPILSVTKVVTRSCLVKKVLPAIRAKWPHDHMGPIFIQQDNARPHIDPQDNEFVEAASQCGLNIRLCFQSPNSPDLNVLDLGFFRAIQSLQQQEAPRTIDELVTAVEKSFETMSSHELNSVFLTLQTCMKEIMQVRGRNNYNVPHISKGKLNVTSTSRV